MWVFRAITSIALCWYFSRSSYYAMQRHQVDNHNIVPGCHPHPRCELLLSGRSWCWMKRLSGKHTLSFPKSYLGPILTFLQPFSSPVCSKLPYPFTFHWCGWWCDFSTLKACVFSTDAHIEIMNASTSTTPVLWHHEHRCPWHQQIENTLAVSYKC